MTDPHGTWTKGCESGHCIEVQLSDEWICQCADPSPLSACESDTCTKVRARETIVKIRDSKNPDGPVLKFDLAEWETFQNAVRRGVFD